MGLIFCGRQLFFRCRLAHLGQLLSEEVFVREVEGARSLRLARRNTALRGRFVDCLAAAQQI